MAVKGMQIHPLAREPYKATGFSASSRLRRTKQNKAKAKQQIRPVLEAAAGFFLTDGGELKLKNLYVKFTSSLWLFYVIRPFFYGDKTHYSGSLYA